MQVAQELSVAKDLDAIMAVVRTAARDLTGADGATFVLRDGDLCFYADEDAVSPLWKGKRFPLETCISGWAMLNGKSAIIEDIYADPRIPADAYRPTFVQSLAMVPIRTSNPVGAIGNYWATRHRATEGQVKLLCALADLTSVAMQNVQLYADLQQRTAEAEDAARAKDEFIMVAAHELRTPLTVLQLQIEGMLESEATAQPIERWIDRAERAGGSCHRLATLIDGLLDVARAGYERIELVREELDLAVAAAAVIERLRTAAAHARSTLLLDAPRPVQGSWDRARIEQLLTSLLSNAIKYGAGQPIEIGISERDGVGELVVRDRGAGIAPEVAARIFERFGRSGPITHYAGLGLGLYLARTIVEAHGGTIRFDSVPGDGCTFTVELPLRPPS